MTHEPDPLAPAAAALLEPLADEPDRAALARVRQRLSAAPRRRGDFFRGVGVGLALGACTAAAVVLALRGRTAVEAPTAAQRDLMASGAGADADALRARAHEPATAAKDEAETVAPTTTATAEAGASEHTTAPTAERSTTRPRAARPALVEPERAPLEAIGIELDRVGAAQRALVGGDPAATLSILGRLDRSHPEGRMLEERAALRAMALCRGDAAVEGLAAALRFLRDHPRSALRGRVQEACGTAKDFPPDGLRGKP